MTRIFRIEQECTTEELLAHGPMIYASWAAPIVDNAQTLPKIHKPGHLLLDTGATHVAIDEQLAKDLNLEKVGVREVHGVGGKIALNVYTALLVLWFRHASGNQACIAVPVDAWGMPDLSSHHGNATCGGTRTTITGVLGRVFLQFTQTQYDGLNGRIILDVDESVVQPRP